MTALQVTAVLFVMVLLLVAAWLLLPRIWPATRGRSWRARVEAAWSRWAGVPAVLAISAMLLAGVLLASGTMRSAALALLGGWLLGLSALLWLRPVSPPRADGAGTAGAVDPLLQALPVALAEVDRSRCLLRTNPALLDLLELPSDALPAGTPVARLVELLAERCASSADFEKLAEGEGARGGLGPIDVLEPLLQLGKVDTEGLVRIPVVHGRCWGLQLKTLPDGGRLLVLFDLSERQRMEQRLRETDLATGREVDRRTRELRAARQEAEQANVSRTRFLTAASHDLLQPMNAARLLAGSLADDTRADLETTATARRIEEAIVAAESILDSLLEAGRLDAQAVKPRITVVPLSRLFDALSAQFAPVAARRKLKLRLRPTRLQVHSDQVLLQRLLSNLLSNALRYTSRGGVLVAARRRGQQVLLQVFDTGIGIEHAQQQLIFHEFRTGQHESPWGERGLGLGLALCTRTAALLQHPFGVVSVAARGSCFHLSVPVAETLSGTPTVVNERASGVALAELRVLCIDDNQDSLNALSGLLQRWGAQVCAAASFRRARELIVSFQPQVLLVDYLLDTELDGFDVIAELRRLSHPELPAAVVSATRSDFLRDQAETQHCELFLKPVKPAVLKAWLSLLPRP